MLTDGAGMTEAPALAKRLGVPVGAVELARACEVIDLHVDTFIPVRLFGYRPWKRHRGGLLGGRFFGQLDLPRATDGALAGAMWSITTNPLRRARGRLRALLRNVARMQALVAETSGAVRLASTAAEYRAARASGAHVCMLAIQGGNALEAAPDGIGAVPGGVITRVTVVHLTDSVYGATSSPLGRGPRQLTEAGRALIENLDAHRVFVDLAHIHPKAFWEAVAVHDRSLPLIVTHTGVSGVTPHWRNLDDEQIRAVASSGGTIGIMYEPAFLRRRGAPVDGRLVIDHMQHVIDVAGEDFVSIGTDYDGAISPPPDLRSADSYPRLVAYMLERGWSEARIGKVLGANFLRAFAHLRP